MKWTVWVHPRAAASASVARYNAEAVVAAFTARLRQTVDLDTVRSDLVGVVYEAFEPAHVSVWLPWDERQRPEHADDVARGSHMVRARRL